MLTRGIAYVRYVREFFTHAVRLQLLEAVVASSCALVSVGVGQRTYY